MIKGYFLITDSQMGMTNGYLNKGTFRDLRTPSHSFAAPRSLTSKLSIVAA